MGTFDLSTVLFCFDCTRGLRKRTLGVKMSRNRTRSPHRKPSEPCTHRRTPSCCTMIYPWLSSGPALGFYFLLFLPHALRKLMHFQLFAESACFPPNRVLPDQMLSFGSVKTPLVIVVNFLSSICRFFPSLIGLLRSR